jgi:hypothetical protein
MIRCGVIVDGGTPYMELYDGTTWRLTNGEREEVGLMTTARLGALMTNAGRPADGELLDPMHTVTTQRGT